MNMIDRFAGDIRIKYFVNKIYGVDYRIKPRL